MIASQKGMDLGPLENDGVVQARGDLHLRGPVHNHDCVIPDAAKDAKPAEQAHPDAKEAKSEPVVEHSSIVRLARMS